MTSNSNDDNPYKSPAEIEGNNERIDFQGELQAHRGKSIFNQALGGTLLGLASPILFIYFPPLPVVGFCLCLNAIRWAKIDLERMKVGEMDPAGMQLTRRGEVLARWGIVLPSLGIAASIAFWTTCLAIGVGGGFSF